MAFGVKGGYKFAVSIGDREDFLTDDKFISFTLIEDIGLSLPYWELVFDCVYPDLLKFFNETQPITIQYGMDTGDLTPIELVIKKPIVVPKSANCHRVTLRGFTAMHSYLETEYKAKYPAEEGSTYTSLQLAQAIAQKYGLTFRTNMDSTNDAMVYYQPSLTDYKFLFTEWLHSYYQDNDIIIPTITTKGELTYNSLSTMIANSNPEQMITFTDVKPENPQIEIMVNANTGLESNTTISNMLGSYVKTRDIYHIDTGVMEHVDVSNSTPIISESQQTSVDESISKSSGFFVQNSSVHANYYKQELINTQKYFSIQSSRQWISAPDQLVFNVYPGDLVLYMTKRESQQVNDQISGMYLVAKKVWSVKKRNTSTNFLLSRENMNYSR